MNTECKKDPWMGILESRVNELEQKAQYHRHNVSKAVETFKEWINTADEIDIIYDVECQARIVKDAKETYTSVWRRYREAEAELERYKEVAEG